MSEIPAGFHGRRYHAYADWVKEKFGTRLQKISINAGFTCPNRDGKVGYGGCSFCDNSSFTPYYTRSSGIEEQIEKGLTFLKKRYRKAGKFLGYLQSYSNTYGSKDDLIRVYEKILSHPEISGLVIGTRPDCIDREVVNLLESLSEENIIQVELGLESCYDQTLGEINRGHDFKRSIEAIRLLKETEIHVTAHFILGLPGENFDMLVDQVKLINSLGIDSVKFHQLQIIKGTKMASQYRKGHIYVFELNEYLDLLSEIIARLDPAITIQRLVTEAPASKKIAPAWGLKTEEFLNKLDEMLTQKSIFQGKNYTFGS